MTPAPIGRVARLQVQTDHLKRGTAPDRWYDPGPIVEVTTLRLDVGGAVGLTDDGQRIADVHHRRHPRSRHRGDNGVSIGFTSHYAAMRRQFGGHIVDGVAGESILLDGPPQTLDSLGEPVVLSTAAGPVRLSGIVVAEPCVEFARFCLAAGADPGRLREALAFLGSGVRGFYATFDGGTSTDIRVGDLAYRPADLVAERR